MGWSRTPEGVDTAPKLKVSLGNMRAKPSCAAWVFTGLLEATITVFTVAVSKEKRVGCGAGLNFWGGAIHEWKRWQRTNLAKPGYFHGMNGLQASAPWVNDPFNPLSKSVFSSTFR
jgi:hypothetical protein